MGCRSTKVKQQMERVRVAPDGSCLFYSVEYLMTGISDDQFAAMKLRNVVITEISNNKSYYTADILGENKTTEEYLEWISNPLTYGGGNELQILSKYYEVNIVIISCVVNEPCIVLAIYSPPNTSTDKNIYLLYTGQHYDALVSSENKQRIFTTDQTEIISDQCLNLANEVKMKKELELKTRIRKKLKCSCGEICEDKDDWKIHIDNIHGNDEDFDYCCSEIEISETVQSADDD